MPLWGVGGGKGPGRYGESTFRWFKVEGRGEVGTFHRFKVEVKGASGLGGYVLLTPHSLIGGHTHQSQSGIDECSVMNREPWRANRVCVYTGYISSHLASTLGWRKGLRRGSETGGFFNRVLKPVGVGGWEGDG